MNDSVTSVPSEENKSSTYAYKVHSKKAHIPSVRLDLVGLDVLFLLLPTPLLTADESFIVGEFRDVGDCSEAFGLAVRFNG